MGEKETKENSVLVFATKLKGSGGPALEVHIGPGVLQEELYNIYIAVVTGQAEWSETIKGRNIGVCERAFEDLADNLHKRKRTRVVECCPSSVVSSVDLDQRVGKKKRNEVGRV